MVNRREIQMEEYNVVVTIDNNDNILNIRRKSDGMDLSKTKFPMDFYKLLSEKMDMV